MVKIHASEKSHACESPFDNIGCKFGHIDKEKNVDKVVSRNKTTTVRSNFSTIEVSKSVGFNINNAELSSMTSTALEKFKLNMDTFL